MEKEEKTSNITFPKWLIMKNISKIKKRSYISTPELAREIGEVRVGAYFMEILSYLIRKEAIIHIETIQTTKYWKINIKKLRNIIEKDNNIYKEFLDYVYENKPFHSGI